MAIDAPPARTDTPKDGARVGTRKVKQESASEINEKYNTLFPEEPLSDVNLGLARLRAIIGNQDPHDIITFVHTGVPCPKARARWHMKQRRFYTPQDVVSAQGRLEERFRGVIQDGPWTCNVAIAAVFFLPNHMRKDADNLMKLVMDAATKAGMWNDDCQVTAQAAFIELDPKNPRTVIALCPTVSSLNRYRKQTFKCVGCGQSFVRDKYAIFHRQMKYCSVGCQQRQNRSDARCARCGTIFTRTKVPQQFCPACEDAPALKRPRTCDLRPMPNCQECGAPVSRRDYLRCRQCALKSRRATDRTADKERLLTLFRERGPLTQSECSSLLNLDWERVRGIRQSLSVTGKIREHDKVHIGGKHLKRWAAC